MCSGGNNLSTRFRDDFYLLLVSYNFTSEIYFSFLIDLVIDCGQIVVKLCYLFMLLFIEFHLFAKFNSFQLNQFLCSNIVGKSLKHIFWGGCLYWILS